MQVLPWECHSLSLTLMELCESAKRKEEKCKMQPSSETATAAAAATKGKEKGKTAGRRRATVTIAAHAEKLRKGKINNSKKIVQDNYSRGSILRA